MSALSEFHAAKRRLREPRYSAWDLGVAAAALGACAFIGFWLSLALYVLFFVATGQCGPWSSL